MSCDKKKFLINKNKVFKMYLKRGKLLDKAGVVETMSIKYYTNLLMLLVVTPSTFSLISLRFYLTQIINQKSREYSMIKTISVIGIASDTAVKQAC